MNCAVRCILPSALLISAWRITGKMLGISILRGHQWTDDVEWSWAEKLKFGSTCLECFFHCFPPTCSTEKHLLPGKLTWNLKMDPCKRRFLLETILFRFHVGFRGCSDFRSRFSALTCFFFPSTGSVEVSWVQLFRALVEQALLLMRAGKPGFCVFFQCTIDMLGSHCCLLPWKNLSEFGWCLFSFSDRCQLITITPLETNIWVI